MLHLQLDKRGRAKRRVGRDVEARVLRVLDQRRLHEIRVVLDLQGRGRNARVVLHVHQELGVEIADADAAGEALVDQLFHFLPCFLDRGFAGGELVVFVGPAWGVFDGGVDVFEGDGEVDQEQVEVGQTPVAELLAGDFLDDFLVMEAVPELGDDEEVFALDEAVFDGSCDALASFLFVAVVAGAVEEAVAGFDGIVDLVGARVIVDFPEAKTEARVSKRSPDLETDLHN